MPSMINHNDIYFEFTRTKEEENIIVDRRKLERLENKIKELNEVVYQLKLEIEQLKGGKS